MSVRIDINVVRRVTGQLSFCITPLQVLVQDLEDALRSLKLTTEEETITQVTQAINSARDTQQGIHSFIDILIDLDERYKFLGFS